MEKGRLLFVEDELDILKMLRIYFDSQGYEVLTASHGNEGWELCRRKLPHLVVLDIMLPDVDGYEILRLIRSHLRTANIPVIFLTQKDERSEKIYGLELGVDDYITKPFDIEELKLRIEGCLRRSRRETLTHPLTGLPTGKFIEDELGKILLAKNWTLLLFGIENFDAFKEIAGPIAINEVQIFLADVIAEAVTDHGTINDFVGQMTDSEFIVLTTSEAAAAICPTITRRFNAESEIFYPFNIRRAGRITYQDIDGATREADFMKLAVGVVTGADGPFADSAQIIKKALEKRRRAGCP